MKYKNDASFVFSYELYMFEQQSSINFNMPLRFFHYGSEVYRDIFPNSMLHRRSMIKIPTPHFITFYNGREKMKERVKILKLSDMFEHPTDNPELELIVTVINLNPDEEADSATGNDTYNKGSSHSNNHKNVSNVNGLFTDDILNRCQSLRDYMTFVNKVRHKMDTLGLNVRTSVIVSVDECIKEDILSDFFIKHRNEVIDVSIFEYDEEGVMDVLREEAREEARKEALTEGRDEATLNAIKNIMDSLHVSVDKAMDILKIDIEKREQLKNRL